MKVINANEEFRITKLYRETCVSFSIRLYNHKRFAKIQRDLVMAKKKKESI